jgi:hypothetical protein
MCVCVYVWESLNEVVCVYVYVRMWKCKCVRENMRVSINMCVSVICMNLWYLYMYESVYVIVSDNVYMICVYVHIYVSVYVSIRDNMCLNDVCLYAWEYLYKYKWYICMYVCETLYMECE